MFPILWCTIWAVIGLYRSFIVYPKLPIQELCQIAELPCWPPDQASRREGHGADRTPGDGLREGRRRWSGRSHRCSVALGGIAQICLLKNMFFIGVIWPLILYDFVTITYVSSWKMCDMRWSESGKHLRIQNHSCLCGRFSKFKAGRCHMLSFGIIS